MNIYRLEVCVERVCPDGQGGRMSHYRTIKADSLPLVQRALQAAAGVFEDATPKEITDAKLHA